MSIILSGVTAGYERDRPIVEGIDLEIRTGEVTVLIGPNGCGKSTLLKTIGRLLKPSTGTIRVDELDVLRNDPKRVARTIAYLPQSPIVPGAITVERLVGYGRAPHQSLLGLRSARDIEMVDHAIGVTGLEELRLKPVSELSGGQRQRAFIAMALAQDTPYVMLDEPTTFLDIRHQVETLDLVRQLHDAGRTSIVVLHDIAQAARYGDRLVVMHAGRIVAEGRPADVVTPDLLRDVYGLECAVYPDPIAGTPVVTPR
ncbi:ABC transporter ATP-binding protein [Devosia lacusdianchii]|jgi:iron complex transport system ATP-binding protein|uniref:ABC transporter ATP-binding protein n=1 Tax=Devosia lacusdianchii TaxID=2917991 RepID=UPI001F05DC4F|nr:ABC transporter ATP-binding protein [Devosia sp. JXJ CY 41]